MRQNTHVFWRILVAFTTPEHIHHAHRHVAHRDGHGQRRVPLRQFFRAFISFIRARRLRRLGEVRDDFRELCATPRHADHLTSLHRRHRLHFYSFKTRSKKVRKGGTRQRQRAPVRHADVLARADGHPPRDVYGVFAGLEHAREQVQRRVGLAPAHALVEPGDEIVVRIARPVV